MLRRRSLEAMLSSIRRVSECEAPLSSSSATSIASPNDERPSQPCAAISVDFESLHSDIRAIGMGNQSDIIDRTCLNGDMLDDGLDDETYSQGISIDRGEPMRQRKLGVDL